MRDAAFLYSGIWDRSLRVGVGILLHNPCWPDFLDQLISSAGPSKDFIEDHRGRPNFEVWLRRCILEGVPVLCGYYTQCEAVNRRVMFPSLGETLGMLLEICLQSPRSRSRYFYGEAICLLEPVSKLLEEALESTESEEGIIIVMDMTKWTPCVFTDKDPTRPSRQLSRLLHYTHQIGAVVKTEGILMNSANPRYWIAEGDKFVGFIPFGEVPEASEMFQFLAHFQRKLSEIKESGGVCFKVGAHWGTLLISGGAIRSNSEIIKATRAMEFSKRDGVIIVTETLKDKIAGRRRARDSDRRFVAPMVLLEGKPNRWVRPEQVTISITDDHELRLYEIAI